MNKYRLLKDLPGLKAGVILIKNDKTGLVETRGDLDGHPWCFSQYEIDDNPDWFEPIEEKPKGRWIIKRETGEATITKTKKQWEYELNEAIMHEKLLRVIESEKLVKELKELEEKYLQLIKRLELILSMVGEKTLRFPSGSSIQFEDETIKVHGRIPPTPMMRLCSRCGKPLSTHTTDNNCFMINPGTTLI